MTYRPFLGLDGGRTVRALSRIVDAGSGGVRRQSASKNRDWRPDEPPRNSSTRGGEPHHDRFEFRLSVMTGWLPVEESVQFGTDATLQSY